MIEIIQDGTVLYTFDLAEAQDQVFEIEYDGLAKFRLHTDCLSSELSDYSICRYGGHRCGNSVRGHYENEKTDTAGAFTGGCAPAYHS